MMNICNVPSMFWTLLFLFSFTVLFLTPSLCSSTPQLSHGRHPHLGNASDQQALLGFLSAITYDPWQSLSTTWKPNVSFCKWRGVICSSRRHRVVSLNVSSLGLQDDEDLALTSTRTLKGSTGYIAPEYGLGGHVTTKGDVYSYGIVLLEMLTRKKPTDNMFVEGVNLQKWVDSSVPKRVGEVVDRSLLRRNSAIIEYEKDLNCLGQLIKVGLLCAKESPKERPTMIGIVGTLQSIKETFLGARGIPKLQSDISHLLCSTSTTHINIGEGQSSSSLL